MRAQSIHLCAVLQDGHYETSITGVLFFCTAVCDVLLPRFQLLLPFIDEDRSRVDDGKFRGCVSIGGHITVNIDQIVIRDIDG